MDGGGPSAAAPDPQPRSFGSTGRAMRGGAREAVGVPATVIAASFLGFGSLVRASDMDLAMGLVSTGATWALPGQVAAVELYAVGASLATVALAVALVNARLLPMVVAVMPMLHRPGTPRWRYFAVAHLLAVTSWVFAMRRCPALPAEERLAYVAGFGTTLWVVSLVATAVGFLLVGSVSPHLSLGLIFLNPIYFLLLLVQDLFDRMRLLAIVIGIVLGPALFLVLPDASLLLTGLIGGTVAFALGRRHGRRPGGHG